MFWGINVFLYYAIMEVILLGDDSVDPSAERSMLITSRFLRLATLCKLLLLLLLLIWPLLLLLLLLMLFNAELVLLLTGLTMEGLAKYFVVWKYIIKFLKIFVWNSRKWRGFNYILMSNFLPIFVWQKITKHIQKSWSKHSGIEKLLVKC